jgi:hypothetical protein
MLHQGEDKAITITITDANGALQSIDAMTDLVCYLYDVKSKTVLAKYRKDVDSDDTEFIELLRVSATEYTAIVPHSVTETFPITNLMIEAEIMESDGRFPDGLRRTKGKNKITDIEPSVITE